MQCLEYCYNPLAWHLTETLQVLSVWYMSLSMMIEYLRSCIPVQCQISTVVKWHNNRHGTWSAKSCPLQQCQWVMLPCLRYLHQKYLFSGTRSIFTSMFTSSYLWIDFVLASAKSNDQMLDLWRYPIFGKKKHHGAGGWIHSLVCFCCFALESWKAGNCWKWVGLLPFGNYYHSNGKWPFPVDFPQNMVIFYSYVKLPDGRWTLPKERMLPPLYFPGLVPFVLEDHSS